MKFEGPVNRGRGSGEKPRLVEEMAIPSIEAVDVEAFSCTPSWNKGTNKSNAVSVEQYTHDLDLHLWIMASLGKAMPAAKTFIDLSDGDDDDEKLQQNVVNIRCPGPECGGLLEPENCRGILPPEVYDRWGNALCEAVILAEEKFYCPYKGCSALMIDDGAEGSITESECPNCRRLFCARFKVPWHSGIDCAEFQKLGKDEREKEDIMRMQLARNHKWRRCPRCGFYVEKSSGCLYMKCRCGIAFCYNCGTISRDHSHFCHGCRR